jgi:hypothetical protein
VPLKNACTRYAIFTISLSQYWKVSVTDFFSLTRNLMLTRCSLLQSDIFRPRVKTRLYLKMRQLVLSEAIELKLVTLRQDRSCSIAVYLFHPPNLGSRAIGLVSFFFVSDLVYTTWHDNKWYKTYTWN